MKRTCFSHPWLRKFRKLSRKCLLYVQFLLMRLTFFQLKTSTKSLFVYQNLVILIIFLFQGISLPFLADFFVFFFIFFKSFKKTVGSFRLIGKRTFIFGPWMSWFLLETARNAFLLSISFELLDETRIRINLPKIKITLLRLRLRVLKISWSEYLYFLSRYAATTVTLRLTPTMQCTSTLVDFLAV